MSITLVSPLDESVRPPARRAKPLASLEGKRIALLDIGKRQGDVFLNRIEAGLKETYGVAEVLRQTKPTFARPAPAEFIHKLHRARPDAVILALAD